MNKLQEIRKNTKKFKAKEYADISLQFWFNKSDRSWNFLGTFNDDNLNVSKPSSTDMSYFGYCLANSQYLDKEDKRLLKIFMESFIYNLD